MIPNGCHSLNWVYNDDKCCYLSYIKNGTPALTELKCDILILQEIFKMIEALVKMKP